MAHSYHELRQLSREDLIQEYDKLAPSTQPGLAFLREELARRDFEDLNTEIHRMTWWIMVMTAAILVLTLVNVLAFLAR